MALSHGQYEKRTRKVKSDCLVAKTIEISSWGKLSKWRWPSWFPLFPAWLHCLSIYFLLFLYGIGNRHPFVHFKQSSHLFLPFCCIHGVQLIPAFVLSLARTIATALSNVFIVTVLVEGYQVCKSTIECERWRAPMETALFRSIQVAYTLSRTAEIHELTIYLDPKSEKQQ